jgi:hypothetical protein
LGAIERISFVVPVRNEEDVPPELPTSPVVTAR